MSKGKEREREREIYLDIFASNTEFFACGMILLLKLNRQTLVPGERDGEKKN